MLIDVCRFARARARALSWSHGRSAKLGFQDGVGRVREFLTKHKAFALSEFVHGLIRLRAITA